MGKKPTGVYLEKAGQLAPTEAERLLSRMPAKLNRRNNDEKISTLDCLALQLEREDEQLAAWRANTAEIREKDMKKQ